ncbi:hypothetical protein [Butyrivibrio sp. WCE2006]|uniref:hypothetical protein n=1 Tax=Butyrivibrio sp. WCE2006 TaxID=1410611 RepID=UPI0005D17A95|nr:hypothetical protein [Butyrivibrio sp. WCE2006]
MIEVTGGTPLDDDSLEDVVGGAKQFRSFYKHKRVQLMEVSCQKCQKIIRINIQESKCECPICGGMNYFAG